MNADALPPVSDGAVKLGETIRLAMTIADDAARTDIEYYCPSIPFEDWTFWNTASSNATDALSLQRLANAVTYLNLRGRIAQHPTAPSLIRFTR